MIHLKGYHYHISRRAQYSLNQNQKRQIQHYDKKVAGHDRQVLYAQLQDNHKIFRPGKKKN